VLRLNDHTLLLWLNDHTLLRLVHLDHLHAWLLLLAGEDGEVGPGRKARELREIANRNADARGAHGEPSEA
jgi:hypothetical protein